MRLTALPVKIGDAFLLRSPGAIILVDAGQDKKDILKLLKREHPSNNHINLLVCTHYDMDHVNGILGILESDEYTFDEIWLPEILGSLAYTISEKLIPILQKLRESDSEEIANTIIQGRNKREPETSSPITENPPIRIASLNALRHFWLDALYHNPFTLSLWRHMSHPIFFDVPIQAMLVNLSLAVSAVQFSLASGAHVRWFKYSASLTDNDCGFGMTAINSSETGVTRYSPDVFLNALYMATVSAINVEALVFKFGIADQPNVLFSSDSDFSFTARPISLRQASIVTAPHHGSETCSCAYRLFQGSNLIYVRSDKSQMRRPGQTFMNQANRYCTICRNKGPARKVVVRYKCNKPVVSRGKCIC